MSTLKWFVGLDWARARTRPASSPRAARFTLSTRSPTAALDWPPWPTGSNPALLTDGPDRGGHRDSTRPRRRDAARAGLRCPLHQPKQLDRFRDRYSPSGAKDDRLDALVLASALRTDPRRLQRVEPTDPQIVELREWSRIAEDLTRERVRLGNRLRQQLWRYYRSSPMPWTTSRRPGRWRCGSAYRLPRPWAASDSPRCRRSSTSTASGASTPTSCAPGSKPAPSTFP